MDSSPLENALRQIQTWFVEGEFEKVKKGCQEILQAAPNNSIAQDLLKKVEEQEAKTTTIVDVPDMTLDTAPAVEPELPSPFPTAAQPRPKLETIVKENPTPTPVAQPGIHHGKSLIINVAILIGLVLLGIGLVYGYSVFFNKDDAATSEETTPEETMPEESTETDPEEIIEEVIEPIESIEVSDLQARNEQRLSDLTSLETALQGYYSAHHNYPDTQAISTILVEEGFLAEMPTPPTVDEVYLYAVFDNDIGEQQVYILTAQIENDDGSLGEWSTGGSIQEFPDYKTIELDHVTILHPTLDEATYLNNLQPTEEPQEEPVRVPRT